MLAMMVAALSFTACGGSEEDDEVEGSSSFLIGTWSVSTNSGNVDSGEYFQFKSDGTFTYVNLLHNDVEIETGIWRIKEDEIVLNWKDSGTSSWTIIIHTKSTMTVTFRDIPFFFTKVSDSKIKKYLK